MKLRSVILLKPNLQSDSQDKEEDSTALVRGLAGNPVEDRRRLRSAVHKNNYDEELDLRVIVQEVRDDVRRGVRSSRGNVQPHGKYGLPVRTRHRLVVENLSDSVRWPDLKDFMRRAGDVTFAAAHHVRSNEGVVHFATRRGLLNAMGELDGAELDGRTIRLVEDRLDSTRSRSRERSGRFQRTNYRLTVENLSRRVNWQELKDHMRKAGEVTFADVFKNCRNKGFVEFATFSDMMNAVEQLDDSELDGRRIRLVLDQRNSLSDRSPIKQSSSNSLSRVHNPSCNFDLLESPKTTKPRQISENLSSTAYAHKYQRENNIQALPPGSPTNRLLDELDYEDLIENNNYLILDDLDGSIISESSNATNRSKTGTKSPTGDESGPPLIEDMDITPTKSYVPNLELVKVKDWNGKEDTSTKPAEEPPNSPTPRYSRFRSSSRSRSPRKTK